MFLVWFWDSKLSGSTFIAKVKFPGKIGQMRVTGGSKNEYPGERWVPKLEFYANVKRILIHKCC